MLSMNDMRQGVTITENGDPWIVMESDFMKKAQRRPVMRTKMRNLRTGQVVNKTFKQGDSIEEAGIDRTKAQVLYANDKEVALMNQETYEQYSLTREKIGDAEKFIHEGMEVEVMIFEGSPVSVKLPIKIEIKIIEAAPNLRGDSASNIMKEAVGEGGIRLQVPLFVNEGDVVRIDTRNGEYVERVNS